MASGTIHGSTGNQYIDAKIEWSSVADKDLNSSTVTAALYYKRNNTGFQTYGSGTFSITINGTKTSATKTLTITEDAWVKAVEATVTVSHSSDGTKSISISASGSMPDTTLSSTTVSATVSLDTILRASTINSLSCATNYFTGEFTYQYTVVNTSIHNECSISLYKTDGTYLRGIKFIVLGTKAIGKYTETVTLSEADLSKIYNALPDTTKGLLQFYIRSYSDSSCATQIGYSYKELTLSIPQNTTTYPSATMTLKPVNSLASPFDALYIRGKTKVDVDFTNVEAKYGASIKSYNMQVLQQGKYFEAPHISEYLTTSGTVDVYGYVKDSRGFTNRYHEAITVIDYSNPRILPPSGASDIICGRCDANGNLSESGTYLKIKAKRSYSKVVASGVQKNFCSIRYRYKADGGSWSSWATILADNASSDEVTTAALLGDLDLTKSYAVQVGVVDTLGESDYTSILIPTEKVYKHEAGSINAFALGKYAEEENTFDVAQDMTAIFRGDVRFMGEAWISRALGTNVVASTVSSGRWGGSGVYYRVCAGGKHIYVAFNVSFTTSSSTVRAESQTIPVPPNYDVYALCPVGFSDGTRGIATVSVSPKGRVNIYAVHKLPGATLSTGETVNWIDGYIDYWT